MYICGCFYRLGVFFWWAYCKVGLGLVMRVHDVGVRYRGWWMWLFLCIGCPLKGDFRVS